MLDVLFDVVLFDFDGVFVESEGIIVQVWQSVLVECGLYFDFMEIVMYFIGQCFDGVLVYFVQQYDFVFLLDFLDVFEICFNVVMIGVIVIEGVVEMLWVFCVVGVFFVIGSNSECGWLYFKLWVVGLIEFVGEYIYDFLWVGGWGKLYFDFYMFVVQ